MHMVYGPKFQPVQPLADCTAVKCTRHRHAVTSTAHHPPLKGLTRHRLPCVRLTTKALAKSISHTDHALGPAPVDRILACLVYVMPICEGLLRLAVVSVRIAQYNLLDWLLWADLKGLTIRPEDDAATLQAVRQACQAMYTELASVSRRLTVWAPPLPLITCEPHGPFSFHISPANCGTLASVAYLGLMSSLAAQVHNYRKIASRDIHHQGASARLAWLRSPQTIMAASACAFMLRLSLVNMQGASGLAKDTYKFVAVSLTLATVCTSFAQLLQIAFGAFSDGNETILQLVHQAGNIAWLHCALSLVEWVLMLTTPCAWPTKLQAGFIAVVTNILVLLIRHTVLEADWLHNRRLCRNQLQICEQHQRTSLINNQCQNLLFTPACKHR